MHFVAFGLISAVLSGLYVDYSSGAVGHICNMAGIFIQGQMPIM